MKKKLNILKWFVAFIVLLATACGHDDIVVPEEYVEETKPYVEIRLAIPVVNPSLTRANPMGGEEGNGRERGFLNEDIVHDINIFFYKDDAGLDGNENTEIKHHIFFNTDNYLDEDNTPLLEDSEPFFDKHYLNLKFDLSEKLAELGEGTHFAVIANIGSIDISKIKKLGDLRNLDVSQYSNAWSKTFDDFSSNAKNMDYFLMSTAYNSNYLGSGTNKITKDSEGHYSGTAALERMYSRLDLWYNKDKNAIINGTEDEEKVTELRYGIVDVNGNEVTKDVLDSDGNPVNDEKGKVMKKNIANVYLTNVLPVNVMQKPSYLFKKVTYDLSSWDASSLKTHNSFHWGGIEYVDELGCPTNYVLEWHTTDKKRGGGGDIDKWFGNTAKSNVINNIKDNTKGSFSGLYHMERTASGNDADYKCDHVSIVSYANENTHPIDCFHSDYLTGMAFRAIYVPDIIYDYSESLDDSDNTIGTLREVSVDEEINVIYRFSPTYSPSNVNHEIKESESLYFKSYEACKTYMDSHPEQLGYWTVFNAQKHEGKWGFVCYYNLWLRHYNNENDDPQATYPMEYATVRNNIYRVAVSFTGPGDPSPTMREPDTMKARIFVRKWNYREEEEIIF